MAARTPKKKTISMRLDATLVDEVRNFIKDHSGRPNYITPGSFYKNAIESYLELMKNQIQSDDRLSSDRDHHKNSR